MTKQTVNVNIIAGSAKPVVHVSQYDHDAEALVFNIYDGDTEFSIPPDATIIMQGTKPDKQFFLYQCDGFSGNTVTCSVHDQMTAVAGNVECELRIYSGGNGIGTANFTLSVEHAAVADDSVTSADTLTALSEIENTVTALRDSAASSASAAKSTAQAANDALSEIENTVTIKTVKVNGTALMPDSNKAVNVTVPTLANNVTTTASGMALDARIGKTLADQASQLAKNTAQIETAGTATNAHSAGEYVMISNALYKVTASVAKGDTWAIGTNATAANIGSEIGSLNADLAKQKDIVNSNASAIANNVPAESAWAMASINGTTVTLLHSHNVKSIVTSNGYSFRVSFSRPFQSAYYAAVGSFEVPGTGTEIVGVSDYTPGGFSIDVLNPSGDTNPVQMSVIALR